MSSDQINTIFQERKARLNLSTGLGVGLEALYWLDQFAPQSTQIVTRAAIVGLASLFALNEYRTWSDNKRSHSIRIDTSEPEQNTYQTLDRLAYLSAGFFALNVVFKTAGTVMEKPELSLIGSAFEAAALSTALIGNYINLNEERPEL